MQQELILEGHPDKWVAIQKNKIVLSSDSFEKLVEVLKKQKLLGKVSVTKIAGHYTSH